MGITKYERIQNFCFFCGKVGHDGRACKDPKANKDHGVEPFGFGSWMGTAAVRTIEEALVVCKESWCEAGMFFRSGKKFEEPSPEFPASRRSDVLASVTQLEDKSQSENPEWQKVSGFGVSPSAQKAGFGQEFSASNGVPEELLPLAGQPPLSVKEAYLTDVPSFSPAGLCANIMDIENRALAISGGPSEVNKKTSGGPLGEHLADFLLDSFTSPTSPNAGMKLRADSPYVAKPINPKLSQRSVPFSYFVYVIIS
ncbi:hypothetical protein K1719_033136 [Acacia pycnantha]|nr:hypothetical protein K1719_033136 [Acacia pycnantha]